MTYTHITRTVAAKFPTHILWLLRHQVNSDDQREAIEDELKERGYE